MKNKNQNEIKEQDKLNSLEVLAGAYLEIKILKIKDRNKLKTKKIKKNSRISR
jgi:hypothetical protein